ncbi:MAG TPA: hypothetical protein VJQ52_00905 [Steroidobacteraceae bacterium]|nr:hypothetical protein [Steroidobacteraceae bacterium]
MNPLGNRYSRPLRALLMLALLGATLRAFAVDTAPAALNIVVIDETRRGWDKGVLSRYGIASRASTINHGPQAEALRKTLRDEEVRVRLTLPTGCPEGSTRDPCASVRHIADVQLPDVIRETRGSTLVVLWPEAGYIPNEKLYVAYFDVDVLQNGKALPGAFYLGYRDWQCDESCVPAAFEASAKELAAMVRYLLELGPAARTASLSAWGSKPQASNVDKWANTCAGTLNTGHVVREYGERFWLGDPRERRLVSAAWRGCNIFAAR